MLGRGGGARRPAGAFLRRRADGAARSWTLIAAANDHGLYSNLITSGTLGGEREIDAFAAAGLKHVQLSFQDFAPANNDRIAGLAGAHAKKTGFAAAVRAAGLPLTVNMVVHRQNLGGVPEMIDMALALGARRLEIAHVQYYAWALANRDALLPSRAAARRGDARSSRRRAQD